MKHADIDKIREAGFINDELHQKIVTHFNLKADDTGGKLLHIISIIGAVMAVGGIILLISANWNDIPRSVKIATGLTLLIGSYAGGYYLRDLKTGHTNSGEALYLAGALLFLANIGLIGQIYNLSSRPTHAILLWWVGIAALPWLLRSTPLHALSLMVFASWLIWESNLEDSLIYIGHFYQFETCILAILGLVFLGFGYCLRRTSFFRFAAFTEYFGLLGFCGFSYPLAWKFFYDSPGRREVIHGNPVIIIVLGTLALALIVIGLWKEKRLTQQWKLTWGIALAVAVVSLASIPLLATKIIAGDKYYCHFIVACMLFIMSLLQIQVGLRFQAASMVNLGIGLVALILLALYISLIDTMERTGWLFLISGVFLVVFGIYLEKQRRKLLLQMRETKTISTATTS